jgi:tRNA wybutosine-synthesizing protein 1
MLNISDKLKKDLQNKHYGVYNHSAVQICEWTKKSLRNEGECYKNQFYGVETYSCAQISPNVMWCDQNCIFCWRPAENMLKKEIKEEVDSPKDIIENLLKEKYKLLTGFKGLEKVNKEKLKIALNEFPSHWAISLSGEPTLYPKLPELIKELKKHKAKSIFVVSNGQNPKVIKDLDAKKTLPTQLYISLDAWDEKSYREINKGIRKDGWERLLKTLNMLGKLKTRTVIRLTVIKGLNDSKKAIKEFAQIIDKSNPDFLEIKSYMHLGYSRERLNRENMPSNEDLNEFCKELEKNLKNLKFEDKCLPSKIILYMNTGKNREKKKPNRWIIPKSKWRIKLC